jgi:hypothetical protein
MGHPGCHCAGLAVVLAVTAAPGSASHLVPEASSGLPGEVKP